MTEEMSWEEYRKLLQKPQKKPRIRGAKRTELPGQSRSFPSKLEAAAYAELELRQKAGEISDLTRYPPAVPLTLAGITYNLDFSFYNKVFGVHEWGEAKGMWQDKWKTYFALWPFYGPGPLTIWEYGRGGKGLVSKRHVPKNYLEHEPVQRVTFKPVITVAHLTHPEMGAHFHEMLCREEVVLSNSLCLKCDSIDQGEKDDS